MTAADLTAAPLSGVCLNAPAEEADRMSLASPPIIVACEVGGGFQIGWSDDAPSYPSRTFAEAVASGAGHRRVRGQTRRAAGAAKLDRQIRLAVK